MLGAAIPRGRREPWLWALALWAVNPLAVVYERKIWPPSVLPIFFVAMLCGWWYRRHWLGSFLFALVATIAGQIHPTAAFLAVAILAWTLEIATTASALAAFHLPHSAAAAMAILFGVNLALAIPAPHDAI